MLPTDLLITTTLYLDLSSYTQLLLAFKSSLPLVPKLNPKQFFNSTLQQEFKHSMAINLEHIQDINQLSIDLLEADQIYELIRLDTTRNCKQELLDLAIDRSVQIYYLIQMQYQNSVYLNRQLDRFYNAYHSLFKYLLNDIQPTEQLFVSTCLTGNHLAVLLLIDKFEITLENILNVVKSGHTQIFRLLASKMGSSDYNLVLETAVMNGKYEIVEMLLNGKSVDVDQHLFDFALEKKHYDVAGLIMHKHDFVVSRKSVQAV
ncbi:hypothetical protein HK103_002000 [Boothiomyces macroporosus]|uniref:Ankyrin repeat protein n=1 Tax=Boothiomyces macroporosus TaxID=261099 RepID=A0AAD5U9T9_9FUNG|nr:hypothetical protein HK103_001994 [Boothiomyces macroporosus]KAJ3251935.1 hypothetical protein HK103_002000 [Boothiomyces macroporosus]